jgi:hypothetical protein
MLVVMAAAASVSQNRVRAGLLGRERRHVFSSRGFLRLLIIFFTTLFDMTTSTTTTTTTDVVVGKTMPASDATDTTCGASTASEDTAMTIDALLEDLRTKYPHQPTFLQAVEEMALSLQDLLLADEFYRRAFLALAEPERIISFRVPWMDDAGNARFNRGWRVEFCRYEEPAPMCD